MKKITLSHGSGGSLMHELIKDLFVKNLDNIYLNKLGDSALVDIKDKRIVYTTDSFVVNPIFFPGGDIGKLSVYGTVNDLAVCGARPRYLSCAMIVEDGFLYKDLERITLSIKEACKRSGVFIVTGDFKVVERGAVDKIFINTSGVGELFRDAELSIERIKPGDKVIISGTIGDHGIAIVASREDLKFKSKILSDCAPLNSLISSIICKDIKFMRDPTRGGLATTLNELAQLSGFNIGIEESGIPIRESVRAFCEILGFDPLYMANEGKVVVVVSEKAAPSILSCMKKHPLGKGSRVIGEIDKERKGRVYLKTRIGGARILDMLSGEQLPRIC